MVLLSFVRSSGWSFDAVFSETEASDGGSAVSFVRHPDKNKIITNINIKIKFFSYLSSFPNRSDPVKKKKYNDLDRYDRGSDRCSGQNRSQDAGNRTDYRHY